MKKENIIIFREILLIISCILIIYGVWLVFVPAAYITSGIALFWFAMPKKLTGEKK